MRGESRKQMTQHGAEATVPRAAAQREPVDDDSHWLVGHPCQGSGVPGHVVFLECYPHVRGGAQATTAALATGLLEHGWTTEVVAPADGPALDAVRASGVPTTVLPAPASLVRYGGDHSTRARTAAALALPQWTARLAQHLRRADADVLDVVDQRGIVLGSAAATVSRVKGVWHVHTPGPRSRIVDVGRRWARVCIAPSRGAARQIGNDVQVIPPAVAHLGATAGCPHDRPSARIVTAGRLHPVKGFDVLIAAVGRLAPRLPGLSLDIYGGVQEGHEVHARALRSDVVQLRLGEVVHFRNHQPSPWQQWSDAAVYVQPSRDEPFGMALVEAMAFGLPVIATAVAGPTDIIEDGRTGVLVAPGDADALAAAIERVLSDRDLAARLAHAGQRHVLETYTVERLIDRTAAAFDLALA